MGYFNIHEAKARLSELVQKAMLGEEVIIAKDHKPVAKLVALNQAKRRRKLGTAKGKLYIAPDFDEPLEDFEDYTYVKVMPNGRRRATVSAPGRSCRASGPPPGSGTRAGRRRGRRAPRPSFRRPTRCSASARSARSVP